MDLILPRLVHRLGITRGVSILMYHAVWTDPLPFPNWCFVSAHGFRKQMAYLKRHFDVLPLAEALTPRSSDRPTAVITFDDGYQNNFDVALPILREFGLPATVFLTTGLIDSDDTVWDARLYLALAGARQPAFEWEGATYRCGNAVERDETFRALCDQLKKLHPDALASRAREIVALLDYDPALPIPIDSPMRMLSQDALTAMSESGLIEFGAHTHNHTILSRLDSAEKRREIGQSIAETARRAGTPCTLFAYPNGTTADYDAECVRILQESGVRSAVTTIDAPTTVDTPPFELRRYGIGNDMSFTRFQRKVHHL